MKEYLNSSIPANYFRGIEAVGGRLYFDETGMTFRSHTGIFKRVKPGSNTGTSSLFQREIRWDWYPMDCLYLPKMVLNINL